MTQKRYFHELFDEYRLKSGLGTYGKIGEALAEEGFAYEDSIFSKWRSGDRVPSDRRVLLALLRIFVKKSAITNLDDANALLYCADQRNLDDEEKEIISISKDDTTPPFSVYRPLVEPSYLYHGLPVNEETTRMVMLCDVASTMRDYWQHQSLCAVAEYFSLSSGGKKSPAEIFEILLKDPYDSNGSTTTIVAITTDPITGQEYLSVTDRQSFGSAKCTPALNCMNYTGMQGGWPHERGELHEF